jgi:hypothetical protein
MKAFCIKLAFCAIALTLGCVELANAQFGPSQAASQSVKSLGNTGWVGKEALQGMGPLAFYLNADGKAIMIDASCIKNGQIVKSVQGTWQANGTQIVIRFGNCAYVGQINGDVMEGVAAYANNPQATWQFAVRYEANFKV